MANIQVTARPPVGEGWRQGRPVEDPDKTKRWGFVTAKPSEYLVHVRRGRVLTSSGQGATCFKWPWDAVAIVPTSLQRLSFRADQVTREKVGVEVVGLAVYRIAEPLIAYRVLNFSYPERAQEKLEQTLGAMFVGATRRLVAGLSVDECLQKRKAALADELLTEVLPIVGGEGSPDDVTVKGWGIVIDTIEIEEVRILSESVFAAMQAPYRSELERTARRARAQAERDIATQEAECRRSVEEASIQTELAVQREREAMRRAEAEAAQARELRKVDDERGLREAQMAAEAELARRQGALADEAAALELAQQVAQQQRAIELAQAQLAAHQAVLDAHTRESELAQVRLAAEVRARTALAEVEGVEGRIASEIEARKAEVEAVRADARARETLAKQLPNLAGAVGQRFGEVNVTQIGGGSPFESIAQAIGSVLALVHAASPSNDSQKSA